MTKVGRIIDISKNNAPFFGNNPGLSKNNLGLFRNNHGLLVLVRADGLRVRRGRTVSPKPSDWAPGLIGLVARCRRNSCEPAWECKKTNEFENVPPFLPFLPEMPMYRGLKNGRDMLFSLPSPSRFHFLSLTLP